MTLEKDSFGNLIVPSYILCKASRERIGSIVCTTKTYDKKFNDISEISFETPLYKDNKAECPLPADTALYQAISAIHLSIRTGVIVTITFHEVDSSPDTKTCTEFKLFNSQSEINTID